MKKIRKINNKSNQKAQLSVFAIIAFIIFGVVLVVIAVNKPNLNQKVHPEVIDLDSVIEGCVKQRTIDAIRLVGLQGGYINPENYLETEFSNIGYGIYNGKDVFLSKNQLEKEIASYVEITLPFCIEEDNFPEFQIVQGKAEASSKLKNNFVEITAKLPVAVAKADKSFTIERDYKIEIPIRLGEIYNIASEIIGKHNNDEYVDLTYLTEINFDSIFIYHDENTIIYSITDFDTKIDDIPYTFVFTVNFENVDN